MCVKHKNMESKDVLYTMTKWYYYIIAIIIIII